MSESSQPSAETAQLSPAPVTPWQLFWRRFKQHRTAIAGGWILIILYLLALLAGFVAPYNFQRQDRDRFFHPPMGMTWAQGGLAVTRTESGAGAFEYISKTNDTKRIRFFVKGDPYKLLGVIPLETHLFGTGDDDYPIYLLGTDQFGRDVLSRLLYGAQISLSIGVIGITLSFSLGMLIGGMAGYLGGWPDSWIMRLCELIMSIPGLYLIMALRSVFPAELSSTQIYLLIVIILSFVRWAGSARVIRGMALSLRERQYVLAAKALGQRPWTIVRRHILPGTFSYVIVAATLSVPYYILGEVVLSYLNVGIQEPDASWGIMLNAAQNTEYLRSYPWLMAPGAAIFITVLAFNFLGDGLRDAADTKAV